MAGLKPGRRTKLRKDLAARLLGLLKMGIPITTACPGAGIDRRTYTIWRKRGREGEKLYAEFGEQVDAAIAEGKIHLLLQIRKHGGKDFRAPAWILEHAHSEEFSAKSQVSITLNEERAKLLETAERVLAPSAFAKLLEAFTAEDVAGNGAPQAGGAESE